MGKTRFKHVSVKKLSVRKRLSVKGVKLSARKRDILEKSGLPLLDDGSVFKCPYDKCVCANPLRYFDEATGKPFVNGDCFSFTELGVMLRVCSRFKGKLPSFEKLKDLAVDAVAEHNAWLAEMDKEDEAMMAEIDRERAEWDKRILDEDKSNSHVDKNEAKAEKVKDLDELWEATNGTIVCPKCDSPLVNGHITEIKGDVALVDWTCKCGFKWSLACPFEDGCISPPDDYPEHLWM
jgi:hypothetical protein